MSKYQISIPKPCTEDWNKMTQTDQGKHCSSCNKVVIDFTGLKNEEIISILLKNKGKRVCGNFFNTQIENPILYINRKERSNWPAVAAMLVAGIFALSANQVQAQIRNRSQMFYDQSEGKYTEPGKKDSLTTYTIKISSRIDKTPIIGATVAIQEIGTFTTDKNGVITFNIDESKIPEIVQVDLQAYGFEKEKISIKRSKIINAKNMELWMDEKEEYMLRGDVMIDETH